MKQISDKKSYLIILLIILAAGFAGFLYINVFVLQKAQWTLLQALSEYTGRRVTLESMRLHPFKGVVLENIILYDEERPVIGIPEVYSGFFFPALTQKGVIVPQVTVSKPVVALTMGDPSGIAPEIILKSLARPSIGRLANYIIIGDATVLRKTADSLKKKLLPAGANINLLDLKNVPDRSFSFGRESAVYGKASIEYIKKAYILVRSKKADCVVTGPINKAAIKMAGFRFPGHTVYLAHLSGAKKFVMK